jgi:hypothetical protein
MKDETYLPEDNRHSRGVPVHVQQLRGFPVKSPFSKKPNSIHLCAQSDFNMPVGTDPELFEFVLIRHSEIIGIMMSGSGFINLSQTGLGLGIQTFMVKPVNFLAVVDKRPFL